MKLLVLSCALSIVLGIGGACADAVCDQLVAALPKLKQPAGKDLAVSTIPGKTYKQLLDDCDATDKFAGQPLPNNNKCSTDKNSVAFLKMFTGASGKTVVFRAKAAVDVDGSPASNLGNPNDQTSTSLFFDQGSKDKTANAEEVPFVVIPQESRKSTPQHKHIFYNTFFGRDTGTKTGDLAVAVRDTFCSFGVVGDTGPEFRLGEASMKTHIELNNPQCENANEHPCLHIKHHGDGAGIDGGAVTYIVFPGSRPPNLISQTVVDVAGKAARDRALKFIAEFAN